MDFRTITKSQFENMMRLAWAQSNKEQLEDFANRLYRLVFNMREQNGTRK